MSHTCHWHYIQQMPQRGRIKWTIFSNTFSWKKILIVWFKFHWSLFLGVQLTISQHCFKYSTALRPNRQHVCSRVVHTGCMFCWCCHIQPQSQWPTYPGQSFPGSHHDAPWWWHAGKSCPLWCCCLDEVSRRGSVHSCRGPDPPLLHHPRHTLHLE